MDFPQTPSDAETISPAPPPLPLGDSPLPPEPRQAGIARSAGIVSIAVSLSRITGLVRERAMAHFFGASAIYDAFLIAFRIPNLTRDLFAEGALSSAFVPVFTRYLSNEGKEGARELYNLVATSLMLVVGTVCLLGMIFSPELVELFASGFHRVPGKFELAVSLTRIMFPFLLLVALAAQAMGVLNACNLFGIPALSSAFFNIGSVIFGIAIGFWLGPRLGIQPIYGMAYGVVFGGAVQLLFQVPSLVQRGFLFAPRVNWTHPGLRNVLRLMAPAILGNASVQINSLINSNFATGLTDSAGHPLNGAVSWLGYAFRFMQLPLGLFGVSVASATLPAISRSAAKSDLTEFRETLSRSISLVILLTLPSAAALAVLGESMIALVYQTGRFTASDAHQTAIALTCYSIGLTGYAALKVLAPAFYALNDARSPMIVSIVSIAVNFAVSASMVRVFHFGHAGLAVSTSAVAIFGFIVLLVLMRHRIHGIQGRTLIASSWRIATASAVMSAVCWGILQAVFTTIGHRLLGHAVGVAIAIPSGGLVLHGCLRALKEPELETAIATIKRPLMRRFGTRSKQG